MNCKIVYVAIATIKPNEFTALAPDPRKELDPKLPLMLMPKPKKNQDNLAHLFSNSTISSEFFQGLTAFPAKVYKFYHSAFYRMNSTEGLVSVVIPVYNEKPTIGDIMKRVAVVMEEPSLRYEIIVVDDCSEDGSTDISKMAGVRTYSLKEHMGKGYALRAGFAKAKGEIIATIDSDGSHRPEELPRLLDPILQDRADLVIGSRYLNHEPVSARKLNAFGVRLFNFLIKIFTRTSVSDSQSGFRAMKSEILKNISLKSSEYEIESEMLVKAARRGFRIKEVPISFEQRTYGVSRLDPLADGFKILLSIFLAYVECM